MEKKSNKELRRLETIYRTFVKMNSDQRKRVLEFMLSKYHEDVKKEKAIAKAGK